MAVTRHTDPDAFLAAAEPVLARDPAVRSLATALVESWRHDPGDFLRDAYVATFAREDAHGFAVRRRGGPVSLENSAAEAAYAFASDAPEALRPLTAVGGVRAACEAFAARWDERFGTSHRLAVHMRHHMLTQIADVPTPSGRYRIATPDDAAWLESRTLAFAAEAGINDSRELLVEGARKRLARGGFRIWEHDARVAFAGWGSAGPHAGRIAPVYTEPFARGRGYSSALVAALARELLDGGRQALFLLTDVANPTSNAIYARIGFRPISDTYRFDFVRPAAPVSG